MQPKKARGEATTAFRKRWLRHQQCTLDTCDTPLPITATEELTGVSMGPFWASSETSIACVPDSPAPRSRFTRLAAGTCSAKPSSSKRSTTASSRALSPSDAKAVRTVFTVIVNEAPWQKRTDTMQPTDDTATANVLGVVIQPIFSKAVSVYVPARKGLALPRASHSSKIALAGSRRLCPTLAGAPVLIAHAVVTKIKTGTIISPTTCACTQTIRIRHTHTGNN